MSTINDEVEKVKKLRKRLSKTIRTSFGDHAQKLLNILEFNKLYNYEISTINERNKLKRSNTYKIIYRKKDHQALFTWLLNIILLNSYLLNYHSAILKKEKFINQTIFRIVIVKECFTITR